MANLIKWGIDSIQTLLSTELNSLANSTLSALGSAYDNRTNKYTRADFELVLASLTPTTGGFISLFLTYQLDGTNYGDVKRESTQQYIGGFSLDTATGAKRTMLKGIELPPSQFKLYLDNQSGVTLGASGNTVKMLAYSPEIQ